MLRNEGKRAAMIKITPHPNYCLIEPQGPLTREDFDAIARQVDPIIENGGRLDGLIIKTRSFPGWEGIGDVIEHFRFVCNHHHAINKVALVTDARLAQIFPAIARHFVEAEVRQFDYDDFDEAVDWIG
jgi:hypothetical protein